ncbi:MAG: 1,4-alpha-glucan branching protein GlgB [Gaiellaceae bacterium]
MIELHNPHGTLGAHPTDGGVVVRAFRPEAASVVVRPDGAEPVELSETDEPGLFEGFLEDADLPLGYELEVAYPDGSVYTLRDPYAFPPTLGELDVHLAGEGRHEHLYERLGAHVLELEGVTGTAFAVWAPNAVAVSVVGDFNSWDGRLNPMRSLGASGIWELFVPDLPPGARYKYELRTATGELRVKADPVAFQAEHPPQTASIVHRSRHEWTDEEWLERRAATDLLRQPVSIYEVHLGSWRRDPAKPGYVLSYRELAEQLGDYVEDLGFTHVELLPVMQHPFSGSWGYQVTGYFAPHSWFGEPDDFRFFVDSLHNRGIGVLLDWVPAHFPRDDWALARFDGTPLYEHSDPRRGAHPDWGTLVFNLGRNEVRNFLLSNGLYWLREFHADGLRVDAVASMLYLDYSRRAGEWVPNRYGGNEDLDSISFLKELNEVVHAGVPGALMCAEESTAWPGVSRPTYTGGLGFGFKWNMGWMHDTLDYFQRDPVYRRYHHHQLTFSLMYAFSENFILPLSHDEVVHGKGSLVSKMPGDRWQKLANLRSLYAYMWAHPGKKLLFMGGELAPNEEWSEARSLDWGLLEHPEHFGVQALVRELNRIYRAEPALWDLDHTPEGFRWLELNDAGANVLAFARFSADGERSLVCACNFAPVPRERYRIGMPLAGRWREVLSTDSSHFGGSDWGNMDGVEAEGVPWHDQPFSAEVTLPPLGVVWLVPEAQG